MTETKVALRNLKEYLTQGRVIRIPPWQREYGWKASENGQVGVLLSDLKDFIDSGDSEYLIGSVILVPILKSMKDTYSSMVNSVR